MRNLILKLTSLLSIKFVIAVTLLCHLGIAVAEEGVIDNNQSTIKLFLPIELKPYSSMIKALKEDFLKNNIENIEIEGIDHWHAYQQGLRVGRVGFYFAPPHFTAWAFSKHDFKAMLRISEPLSYVIAAKRANSDIFEINDLTNKRICSEKAFNLSYLLGNSGLDKQLRSANIEIVESVEKQMSKTTTSCDAFSISDHLFKKVSIKSPAQYIRLHQSTKYNNYALIAHPSITDQRVAALTQYFLKNESQSIIAPLLKKFTQTGSLIISQTSDYPSEYYETLSPYWKK